MNFRPNRVRALLALLTSLGPQGALHAAGADVLTGDVRLACEALLCLSSSTRPSECAPSLARYFSISHRRLTDTIQARLDFLRLCPVAEHDDNMRGLVDAMARGAGRCDAAALNRDLALWIDENGQVAINNRRPSYCSAYAGHAYTSMDGGLPRYVGTPEQGGYWVEAKDYDKELARYQKALEARRQGDHNVNQYWGY